MSNVAADNVAKLREMISGYMLSQIISATAVLGLADLLASGTVSGKALAEATGTHGASLLRLLRVLTACGLLEEAEPERFRLTALGALLRTDVPGSLRNSRTFAWCRGDLARMGRFASRAAHRARRLRARLRHGLLSIQRP